MGEPQPLRGPIGRLTFAGRILALATLLLVGGMFYLFVMFLNAKIGNGTLPSGRYSVPFLLIPGVIVALVFFVVVSFILELMGVRIWRELDD